MRGSRWIARSGQGWKIRIFYGLIVLTLALTVCFVVAVTRVVEIAEGHELGLALGLVASAAGSLGWLLLSIRCAKCGHRPVWRIVRSTDAGEWMIALLAMPDCPRCRAEK